MDMVEMSYQCAVESQIEEKGKRSEIFEENGLECIKFDKSLNYSFRT